MSRIMPRPLSLLRAASGAGKAKSRFAPRHCQGATPIAAGVARAVSVH